MTTAAKITLPFYYPFNTAGTLEEVGTPDLSSSPYFWLSSGGQLRIYGGMGHTMEGEVTSGKWYTLYKQNNPQDSDMGWHPQSLFRLPTRFALLDAAQEMTFTIEKYHLSNSPNRTASNGLHFMARYLNSSNLYYLGIRADGTACIKRKWNGEYTTLACTQVYPGIYNHISNPILLPVNVPIRLKATVRNMTNQVYLMLHRWSGTSWTLLLTAFDNLPGLMGPGRVGVRTDFMDCTFEDYRIA